MEAAEPFHGDDELRAKAPRGEADRIGGIDLPPAWGDGEDFRSARRTRIRLRVEAAVVRIFVLAPAVVAHPEVRHRGVLAVVRDVARDGVTRAAIRSVGEGI